LHVIARKRLCYHNGLALVGYAETHECFTFNQKGSAEKEKNPQTPVN